jgi:hypothetical protein
VLGELILVGFVAVVAITFFYSVASLLFLGLAIGAVVGIGAVGIGANVGGIAVIAVVGAILLLAPGIYLLAVWSVAVPVVVLERPGGRPAVLHRGGHIAAGCFLNTPQSAIPQVAIYGIVLSCKN